MEYITLGDLVTIQERIGAHDPWRFAIVNRSGLLSALATPFQSAFGAEAFPALCEKAGALVFLLIQNHPFRDGNKRIAAEALALFLTRNGSALRADEGELDAFTTAIASGELRDEAIVRWIEAHAEPPRAGGPTHP
jgi:death on curing protein